MRNILHLFLDNELELVTARADDIVKYRKAKALQSGTHKGVSKSVVRKSSVRKKTEPARLQTIWASYKLMTIKLGRLQASRVRNDPDWDIDLPNDEEVTLPPDESIGDLLIRSKILYTKAPHYSGNETPNAWNIMLYFERNDPEHWIPPDFDDRKVVQATIAGHALLPSRFVIKTGSNAKLVLLI